MTKNVQNTILIVGGAGFIGHHLVSRFLSEPSFCHNNVYVISRSAPTSNFRTQGAIYLEGNLTDYGRIWKIIDDVKPTVIIHAASPSTVSGSNRDYKRVNILGTRNLLKCAKNSPHVRAFIFTSSSTIAKGKVHRDLDETAE